MPAKYSSSGQTMLEMVIVLGLIGTVLVALVGIVTVSVRNSNFTRDEAGATRYAQEAMEWVRQERDKNWTNFYAKVGYMYCINTPTPVWPSSAGACLVGSRFGSASYWREVTLTNVGLSGDPRNKVDVAVYWQDSKGIHSSTTTTTLTRW